MLSALVTPEFEKHRNRSSTEKKFTPSSAEQRDHGSFGHPQNHTGDNFASSKCVFARYEYGYYLNELNMRMERTTAKPASGGFHPDSLLDPSQIEGYIN